MFYVVNISIFGSRELKSRSLLYLANRSRSLGAINLFFGVPLHYERGDRVGANLCWLVNNQYLAW